MQAHSATLSAPDPADNHWSLVKPVRESDLIEEERRGAAERRDLRIP
jgi:hypothetical protein